ncbi:type III secretion protein [Proteus columbae]|uniref:type III secretion protein n=1 Tax=Proteus columbae TaxID=1987580 RepID=UPI000C1F64F1|nr:type III secretion protein [Proteus columbae]
MSTSISNSTNEVSALKDLFANMVDEKEKIDINKEVPELFNQENKAKSIIDNIDKLELSKKTIVPEIKQPKINKSNLQYLISQLEKAKKTSNNTPIVASNFNFLSNEMMSLISLMIKYLQNMIKKYEASRELGNLFMQIGLDVADKVKENLYKKADIMLSATISSAAVSMTIHGIGAFTSMNGLGKDMIGSTNKTMITGGLVSSLADPISKIIDQSIQTKALQIEGDVKVLEARSHALNQVANNNSDIQREALDIIKALIQAIEAIIRANQDAVSSISGNVRG